MWHAAAPAQVRTAYVEHDIQGTDVEMSVVDFVFADPNMLGASREEISKVLGDIGFSEAMKNAPINSLSGGWRMKLALARAMIIKADIMLLDEPTNHLVSTAASLQECCRISLAASLCCLAWLWRIALVSPCFVHCTRQHMLQFAMKLSL